MKEVVYIDEKNYRDYLNLEVIAFSFAYGGAMGSPGEILFITNEAPSVSGLTLRASRDFKTQTWHITLHGASNSKSGTSCAKPPLLPPIQLQKYIL